MFCTSCSPNDLDENKKFKLQYFKKKTKAFDFDFELGVEISMKSVSKNIGKINDNKAPGMDGITKPQVWMVLHL